METDVPWDVKWTSEFQRDVEDLKDSGIWSNVKGTIEDIIENPCRKGRYKDGTLKGCRTTHIEEKVICWKVKPGVSSDLQDQVEEVFFLFISHHDDMGFGINNFSPVERSSKFQIELSYYSGYEIERIIHEIFSVMESIDGTRIQSPDWRDENVVVEGSIPPDEREKLESVLPDGANIEFDDSVLF